MNEVELTVDRIAVGGKGLGLDPDGRATFVAGSVPTERVLVRLTKEKSRFAEGHVIRIDEPSEDRVEPPCKHGTGTKGCGGCDWQHISGEAQRRLRVAIVEDALRRVGKVDTSAFDIRSAEPLPQLRYRTGVRMLVDKRGSLAYRQPRSHRPFTPRDCVVTHPLLEEVMLGARCIGGTEATIRIGAATGERMLVVDTESDQVSVPEGVIVAHTDFPDDAHVHEVINGVRLRISAGAFFQSSPMGASQLVDVVTRAVGDADRSGVLIDAYSGGGLFSATVGAEWASGGGRVVAVESNPVAVGDARVNAPAAEAVVSRFEDWAPVPADVVIADPARAGLEAAGVRTVVGTGAPTVVLVSCDAASLGRDAALLVSAGYRIAGVTVLDMFNQTSHVEAVTRFELSG